MINIFESSKEFSLSFFQDGLFIKMNKKMENISSVGSSGTDKKAEIGRKYTYFRDGSSYLIEEFIETEPTMHI